MTATTLSIFVILALFGSSIAGRPGKSQADCKLNEVFTTCGYCESSCGDLWPMCSYTCKKPGCYCPTGDFVRLPDGDCIPIAGCFKG
uniref:TIL domain-containing protein n=1 Tax=Panagrellus redivivus TaxID=6233 RepID=A0A7E4V953_PANRE